MFLQLFFFLSIAMIAIHATNNFSLEDQAIWIDRFNSFRTRGLPWSAGNMRRIGWNAHLATTAASTAAKCLAKTGPGVNVYQSSSINSSSIIDEAIQQWVVETSMTTLPTIDQPGASGIEIGKGTYNSYSQVLWAPTTSVGCASATCSGGDMAVCEFSPAGNDGSSAWYIHADTASMCPSGTTASEGLCIVEGDKANDPIAPIPACKWTYEVYPAYVADMHAVLVEAARSIANGETQTAPKIPTAATTVTFDMIETPASLSSKTSLIRSKKDGSDTMSSATDRTPSFSISDLSSSWLDASSSLSNTGKTSPSTPTSDKTDKTTHTDPFSETSTSTSEKTDKTSRTDPFSETSTSTSEKTDKTSRTGPSSETSTSTSEKTDKTSRTGPSSETSTSTSEKTDKTSRTGPSSETSTSTSEKTDKTSSMDPSSTSTSEKTDKTTRTDPSTETSPKQKPQTIKTLPDKELGPGRAKASYNTGSRFTNQANKTSHSTPSSGSGESATASAPAGISIAGIAGIIVVAVVCIAGISVVVSYKKNQRRQREIMRDGGIRTF